MIVSICENRKIPCTASQRKELKIFEDARCTKLNNSRIFDWRHNEVWAKNYVGVIQVPGLTLEILPKIDKNNLQPNKQEILLAQSNLLYMLSFTRKLPFEERDLASLKLQKLPLLEILIRLFANRLLEELRRGVDHAYVYKEENLSRIKGKILMNQHLMKNITHRERFYIGFDEFLDDTLLNCILKATSRRLVSMSTDTDTQRILMEITGVFDEVRDIFPDGHHFDKVHLHRNNERFQTLLDFCRIVWQEKSPNPSSGDSRTFSILFPMEKLFEEYIARFIKRYADDFGFSRNDICIQSEGCGKYLLQEKKSQTPKFKLQPDLIIKAGSKIRLILDTKWKCLKSDEEDIKNGVSSSDMYQMCAYATRYDCNNVILLYPDTGEVTPKSYSLLGNEDKKITVTVINLNLDLRKERNKMLVNLSELLSENIIVPNAGCIS